MDNLSTTSDAVTLASAANFLLSLGNSASIDSNNPDAQLFANFLSQSQNTVQNQSESGSANASPETVTQTSASQVNWNADTTNQTVAPTLKNLAAAWHTVLDSLQNQSKPKFVHATFTAPTKATPKSTAFATKDQASTASSNTSGPTPSAVSTTATPATASTSTSATATTTTCASSTLAGSTNDASGAAATDSTSTTLNLKDPKTIAELLAELQILAQMIARQLQTTTAGQGTATAGVSTTGTAAASGTASGTDANAGAGATGTSTNDPASSVDAGLLAALNAFSTSLQSLQVGTGAAASATSTDAPANVIHSGASSSDASTATPTTQALTDLLALAQLVAKQLDAAQSGTSIAPTTTQTANTATQAATSGFLVVNVPPTSKLQALMDALKTGTTSSAQTKISQTANASDVGLQASATVPDNTLAASSATSSNVSAPLSKNTDLSQSSAFALYGSSTTPTSSGTPTTGFVPLIGAAGLTDSSGTKDGAFDLRQDSQNNNNFSASAQNVSSDANTLSSAMESSSSSSSSPYSFASQLAMAKVSGTGVAGLPPAVEQVMLQLNRSAKSGDDQMTLQLNPTDLGRVSIKLNISSDGKVQGTVVANNPATLDMLQKDSRSLERALQDAGLRADSGSLQFSLGGQSGHSSGQLADKSAQTFAKNTTQNLAANDTATTADATETYYVTPGRVNLRV